MEFLLGKACAWGAVSPRLAIGAVLAFSASMKLIANNQSTVSYLAASLSTLEFALSFWLFSGWRPKQALMVAASVFLVFGIIGVYRISLGRRECGCFGTVSIPLSASILLSCLSALCAWLAATTPIPENFINRLRLTTLIPPGLAFSLCTAWMTSFAQPVQAWIRNDTSTIIDRHAEIDVEKRFPEFAGQLPLNGQVIVANVSCPTCLSSIRQYLLANNRDNEIACVLDLSPSVDDPLPIDLRQVCKKIYLSQRVKQRLAAQFTYTTIYVLQNGRIVKTSRL